MAAEIFLWCLDRLPKDGFDEITSNVIFHDPKCLKKGKLVLPLGIILQACFISLISQKWSIRFYVPPDMTDRTLCFWVVRPSVCLSFCPSHFGVPLCVQCPAKTMHFQQITMHALHCQHDVDVHLIFRFDLELHITSF